MVYSKKISLKFQDSILEQAKVTEQDYVFQFLKKLKLYAKLAPKTIC